MERKSRRRCKSSVVASVWEVHGLPSAADASRWVTPAAAPENNETPPVLASIQGLTLRPCTFTPGTSRVVVVSFFYSTAPAPAEVPPRRASGLI